MKVILIRKFSQLESIRKMNQLLIFTVMTFVTLGAHAGTPSGSTEFVRGQVEARLPDAAPRMLKRESPIYGGEKLKSGVRSFAVFAMRDGSRFTLRPTSTARVPEQAKNASSGTPVLELEKGALRGRFPASDSPERKTIKAPNGDVHFEEGEFTLRWCEQGCGVEPTSEIAGKALVLNGSVQATNETGKTRALKPGGKLRVGDTIETGSDAFVMMLFRDGSKIALQPESDLTIKGFRFDPSDPKKSRMHLKLSAGAGRFKTGSIGKIHPAGMKVFTPVVMTGVRGTGFDLVCVGSCAAGSNGQSGLQDGKADGLYTRVWEGRIIQSNGAGNFEFAAGDSSYFGSSGSEPVRIARLPAALEPNAPHPGEFSVDSDYLFQMNVQSNPPAGLYMQVHSGSATLTTADGTKHEIAEGSTAYMDPQAASVVEGSSAPGFMGAEANCN